MDDGTDVRILAVSGSLRRASSNTAVVKAAVLLAPSGVAVSVFEGLALIPAFNSDLDTEPAVPAVTAFRAMLRVSDAVLVSSPEYAHGVPGALKNALDWIVGSGELIDKPIALVNASTRAIHAYASLREILTTMSGRVIDAASITIPLDGSGMDADAIVADARLSGLLRSALDLLASSSRRARAF